MYVLYGVLYCMILHARSYVLSFETPSLEERVVQSYVRVKNISLRCLSKKIIFDNGRYIYYIGQYDIVDK
jgi:hypothetical protein